MGRLPGDEIIGKRVRIDKCVANSHGKNQLCVCHLVGKIVTIERRYRVAYASVPTYHIQHEDRRVTRAQVTLLRNQFHSNVGTKRR